MNNFITLFLTTLVHIGLITKKEAEKLNTELQQSTLPDDFESAYQMVQKVFEKADVETKKFTAK